MNHNGLNLMATFFFAYYKEILQSENLKKRFITIFCQVNYQKKKILGSKK